MFLMFQRAYPSLITCNAVVNTFVYNICISFDLSLGLFCSFKDWELNLILDFLTAKVKRRIEMKYKKRSIKDCDK